MIFIYYILANVFVSISESLIYISHFFTKLARLAVNQINKELNLKI